MASKSSERLKPALLEAMKDELQRKKKLLARNINTELDEMRSGSRGHHLADMDDLGGEANDEETSFKILEISTAELNQIDNALERIEKGTFGTCSECSKQINLERLKALPFASLCIECQRTSEKDRS